MASLRIPSPTTDIGERFRSLAETWRRETRHLSSVTKMITHPAYLRILGLGPSVVPLLLQELQTRPDHWLIALKATTGEDPAREGSTFHEAVQAWLEWGQNRGHLP